MSGEFTSSDAFQRLREKAEQLINGRGRKSPDNDREDLLRLVHEIEVYQVELELQNEELLRAKAEAESSQKEFFDLYDSSPVAYVTLNGKYRIERVNQAACRLLERDKNLLAGSSIYSWFDVNDLGLFQSFMKNLAFDGQAGPLELRLRVKEGPCDVQVEGTAKIDEKKGIRQFRLAFVDITDRKRAQQDLQASEEGLRLAVKGGRLGIWNRDLVTGKIVWNRRLYDLLRRDPDGSAITGETFFGYIHPEDIERVRRHVDETLTAGADFFDEFRIVRDDGKIRWLAAAGRMYRDSRGRPVRMAGVNYDITDRKQAEQALQQSEARYRSFIDLTGQYGWTTDPDGNIVEGIPALSKITGLGEEEVKGWGWAKAVHPDDRKSAERKWKRAVVEKSDYESEFRLRRSDGMYRYFLSRGVPVLNDHGSVQEWVGTCIDITERKEMETLLKRSHEELEKRVEERTTELSKRAAQLARLTSELTLAEQRERRRIAEILHDDLQQLMVAAKMGQEMLMERAGDSLKPEAERVLDLINRSIAASRALTAELSPHVLRSGDLSASLEWLVRWMGENQGFEVNLQAETGIILHRKDLTVLLFQSIREILFNVVKHAGVNSADVKVERKNGNLQIIVSDKGAGFDPESVLKNAGAENRFGLLTITERFLHLGGRLEIESAPHAGSTVSLLIPLDEGPPVEEKMRDAVGQIRGKPVAVRPGGNKIRVLIADDHPVLRQGLHTMLGLQPDIEVVGEASDGKKTVELARKMVPDVILMDIDMPNMNGVEATRRIHSEFPGIRIIGLSLYDEESQADAMIRAGASAYRCKSDNTELLLAAIRGKGG